MATKQEELTILDICQLEGAVAVIKRYAGHLQKHADAVLRNYESTDFDEASFLADVAFAMDNVDVVEQAAAATKRIMATLRAEVVPMFNKEKEDEE